MGLGDPSSGVLAQHYFHFSNDLFGDPIDPKRGGPGRPRHMPTAAQRQLVRDMHAEGRSQTEIAQAIGITCPTLLLNYFAELESSSQAWRRRGQKLREGNN